ncbi:hypothetical protein BBJ28_00016318 [Nothophytophthora sp. Chile5]|nr:hypothetical protein BBJ28_00016318 [Nothophytophthora sp. Chile5]
MGFICPECKVMFQSSDQLGMHYNSVHELRSRPGNSDRRTREAPSAPPNGQQFRQQQSHVRQQTTEDVHENFLRDLEPQLAELKEASLSLGSALETQNAQLDRLDSKIGRVHHDMKRVGIQANKIAGRKMQIVFRFRCAFQEVQTEGCTFRAYTLGDDSDVWGFQSEKSSHFLGLNRLGNLKIRGADLNSYEQFLVEAKPSTPLFCLASYFGLGGWVAMRAPADSSLSIIRGTPENKPSAAQFKIVNLEDGINEKRPKA